MAHKIDEMNKVSLSGRLAVRKQHWIFEIEPPHGQSFLPGQLNESGPTVLPSGTTLRVRSDVTRFRSVVVTDGDTNEQLFDTLTGIARPSVTAGVYRLGPKGLEVAVIFMKRMLGEVPSFRHLSDVGGFVVCAEPPGGLVDDVDGSDFLSQVPSNQVLRQTVRREIAEELGEMPIRSLRIGRYPLTALGVARTSTFQAFVEVDPTATPRPPRPEETEQIVGRKFMPLDTVLELCAKVVHRRVFWGRESTHTWKLLQIDLKRRARRSKNK